MQLDDLRSNLNRREILVGLIAAGGASSFPGFSLAATQTPERDWEWMVGNWDVLHRRLQKRLVGDDHWDEFAGKCSLWQTLGGLGNCDDNLLHLPGGDYRALAVRAFDPATRKWAIWWLDGRSATKLDPPVVGSFTGDEGEFLGNDTFNGRPITVRFRWHEVHGKRPHWDQGYSTDMGATWEINWRNYFTRTSATPTPIADTATSPSRKQNDWDFLVGRWNVRNRRLTAEKKWQEFPSTLHNWPVMGGLGNVGDNVFESPAGTYRGLSMRAFDEKSGEWQTWWLDGRNPSIIATSVRGKFSSGVGTLTGDETIDGRPVKVRVLWSGITASSAHWEQALSRDEGASWETNWTADFTRTKA